MTDDNGKDGSQSSGGEDESSTENNGENGHLNDDQKSPAVAAAEEGEARDRDNEKGSATKTQDLAKAGRKDFDPNAGEE